MESPVFPVWQSVDRPLTDDDGGERMKAGERQLLFVFILQPGGMCPRAVNSSYGFSCCWHAALPRCWPSPAGNSVCTRGYLLAILSLLRRCSPAATEWKGSPRKPSETLARMPEPVTYSGFRKTTGPPASGMSLWYQPLCLPGNAEVVQCGVDRAGGKAPVAAASLAKSSLGETKDSWVGNSKALPRRLSFVNSGHAKQQLEGALGIWVWPDNNSLLFLFFFHHR